LHTAVTVPHEAANRCNNATQLNGVVCDYIYLKLDQFSEQKKRRLVSDRRPSDPNRIFASSEFQTFIQKAISTVDLIFSNGIDWQIFFQSFVTLQSQYDERLTIQAIEKKIGSAFVIRVEVPAEVDKAAIERQAKELYETKLQLQGQHYRAELQAKDGQISLYQEQLEIHLKSNTNLLEIVKIMAKKENQPTYQTTINAQTLGATHTGSGNITNFAQNINSNINDVTQLINALREQIQTLPDEQRQEAQGHLADLEDDFQQPPNERTLRRIKSTLAALLAIGCVIAGTADFSNNVLEISNKLGIPIIQTQPIQPIPR
jgi:hypothetical protein